jgi:putative nucleotidyltransferase with HDIG domain
MSHLPLEEILGRLQKLPALSVVLAELMESFEKESLCISQLAGKIGLDQGLTARVLRVANSAFYGYPSRIASINDAVVVLGFGNVRSLAVAGGIIEQFSSAGQGGFDRLAFWRHSIGTAVCAKVLADRTGQNPETAFTAGLLHDIGKLVMDISLPEHYDSVLKYCAQTDCAIGVAEKKILGVDHALVGYELAQRWKFPLSIQLAIRNHHAPQQEPLSDLVHAANVLCHALDIGNGGYEAVPPLSSEAWDRLGLEWKALRPCFAEIERINVAASLLLNG